MIFDTSTPLTQYYDAPDFATGITRTKLGLLGYDQTGQQNTWGKISSWIPGVNLLQNQIAKKVAGKGGAGDTALNIKQDFDNRLMKTGLVAGAAAGGLGIAGAAGLTGTGALGTFAAKNASQLMKSGLDLTTKSGGALAFDQNQLITEGQFIYR